LQINEAIAEAICHTAEELSLKAVAVFTETGSSAALVSKYRPRAPIIGFSPEREARRKMSLYWSVLPRSIDRAYDIDTLAASAEKRLLEEKLVKKGDIVGVIAGTPLAKQGTTNLLRLIRIGG
jgi:pyruvate kinase